ncbi:RNA polymerase sigma factor [Maribacter sp. 2307ULW6-5]|uniref:RNA polymerase sigma factor n=1 Tax=Maribacter sp. 2307ULW6-5 TaxID=3386275 RepID=UPI0039BCB51E
MAFSKLVDIFWNQVYGFQLKRTQDPNDAEDVTIQTFSKAFDKLHTYNEQYVFKTWLLSISKNVHIDLVRKRKKTPWNTNSQEAMKLALDNAPSMEDRLIQEQNLASLLQDIKKLKPHYQEVINLRYFNELSYAAIAETLNEPVNNIKVKLLRAKKLLSEIIKNR